MFLHHYKARWRDRKMMKMLGSCGMTVGNHEFDDGPEVLRPASWKADQLVLHPDVRMHACIDEPRWRKAGPMTVI